MENLWSRDFWWFNVYKRARTTLNQQQLLVEMCTHNKIQEQQFLNFFSPDALINYQFALEAQEFHYMCTSCVNNDVYHKNPFSILILWSNMFLLGPCFMYSFISQK